MQLETENTIHPPSLIMGKKDLSRDHQAQEENNLPPGGDLETCINRQCCRPREAEGHNRRVEEGYRTPVADRVEAPPSLVAERAKAPPRPVAEHPLKILKNPREFFLLKGLAG